MRFLRGVYNMAVALLVVGFHATAAALSGLLKRQDTLGYWAMHNCGRWLLPACGVQNTVEGAEHVPPTGGFVLAANHESHFDAPFLLTGVPRHMTILAKRELFRIPILAQGMRGVGLIELDRGDKSSAVASLSGTTDYLKNGGVILVFAEGHRTTTGELQAFKKGAAVMALQAQVPILPVAIVGTRQVLASGEMLPRPAHVRLMIGPPISVSGRTVEDRDAVTAEVHAAVAGLRARGHAKLAETADVRAVA